MKTRASINVVDSQSVIWRPCPARDLRYGMCKQRHRRAMVQWRQKCRSQFRLD